MEKQAGEQQGQIAKDLKYELEKRQWEMEQLKQQAERTVKDLEQKLMNANKNVESANAKNQMLQKEIHERKQHLDEQHQLNRGEKDKLNAYLQEQIEKLNHDYQ